MSYKYSCVVCFRERPRKDLRPVAPGLAVFTCRTCNPSKKRNKYHADPVEFMGHRYASKLEARYARHLEDARLRGEIIRWVPHPCRMPLEINGVKIGVYTPDFSVRTEEEFYFVDTKGQVTSDWKFREKVIRACYPLVDLRIVRSGDF